MPQPKMKSIKELNGYHFEIPVYQRGFRWTRQQMKELIEDLYDFMVNGEQKIYCLQNVMVRQKADSTEKKQTFEVIDGQQRLTALWILIMSYIKYSKDIAKVQNRTFDICQSALPIYSFSYDEKDSLTDYVKSITDGVSNMHETTDILAISEGNDIDSSLIHDAFFCVIRYENIYDKLSTILGNRFTTGDKEICIIWNEIDSVGENVEIEKQTNYAIERFSNLNAGKIPLTESELIKAYFVDSLSKLPDDRIAKFSLQWEEMEKGLNNKDFWSFITSGKYEETRIDFLFRIYLYYLYRYPQVREQTIELSEQHTLSREISKIIIKPEDARNTWDEIVRIYDTLYDWFNDYYYYHMIGLIISVETKDASRIVEELYAEYIENDKPTFKEKLKERIRNETCYKIPFDPLKNDWNLHEPEDIMLEGTEEKEISYTKNKDKIKPILLLFNVSLLVNAYMKNPENATERFPFLIYKRNDNPIEIEHINPHHLEGKKEDRAEYTPDEKKKWAEETIEIIRDDALRDNLSQEIDTASWSNQNRGLIERIEDAAQLNDLSNLTLVDKNLNIRYGDNFFQAKRRHILAAKFGNPINESGKTPKKYYEQSVIFPGTMWVFMRQYTVDAHAGENSNDVATHDSDADEKDDSACEDRWNKTDREEYLQCIQKSIYRLLKPEQKQNSSSSEEGN